jgi:hypothetical protein
MDAEMESDMAGRMKDSKKRWSDNRNLESYDGVDALTVFWKESSIEEGKMFSAGKMVSTIDFKKGIADGNDERYTILR